MLCRVRQERLKNNFYHINLTLLAEIPLGPPVGLRAIARIPSGAMYPISDSGPSSDTKQYRPYLCELDLALGTMCHDILGLKDNSPTVLALRENGIQDFTNLIWFYDKIDGLWYTPIGETTKQRLELRSRVTL